MHACSRSCLRVRLHSIALQHLPEQLGSNGKSLTRMDMLDHLPTDLHQFVIFHNWVELLRLYPALYMQGGEQSWGPGPNAAYLGGTHFMHSNPG